MDGKGRWIDNVFIERLWRSVKYEEVYLHAYANGTEARTSLIPYFGFYNARRSHQALDYRTPDEVYFGALGDTIAGGGLTIDHDRDHDREADFGGYRSSGYPLDSRSWSFIRGRFSRQRKTEPQELLPPAAADRLSSRRLTRTEDDETIIINRSGRSTYPKRNLSEQAEPPLSQTGWPSGSHCAA